MMSGTQSINLVGPVSRHPDSEAVLRLDREGEVDPCQSKME